MSSFVDRLRAPFRSGADDRWLAILGEGGKQKLSEHQEDIATIEMGARQYVPGLGRFLSVDPVEGGCANDYTFGFGDPLNHPDIDGRDSCKATHGNHALGLAVGIAVIGGFVAGAVAVGILVGGPAAVAAAVVEASGFELEAPAVPAVIRYATAAASFIGGVFGAVGKRNELCNGAPAS